MDATIVSSTTQRPHRATWRLLVAGGMLLHLVLALSIGLSPDEAHYALYGVHVDWSYFDHPPLVGWLQAPFALAGGADVLMRVIPMASWLLSALLTARLCQQLPLAPHDSASIRERRAAWGVALLLVDPIFNLLGVALVPDSLLMPLALAAMLATWNLRDPDRAARLRDWLVLALALALSVLSKYTGVFILAGALSSLAAFHGRRLARYPGFWVAATVAVASALPILGWNEAHHWASISYQARHAEGGRTWKLATMLRAVGLQWLVYGLATPFALGMAWRRHSPRRLPAAIRAAHGMSVAFGAPVLIVFVLLAGRGSSLPQWTACGWAALIPLTAAGCARMRGCAARALLGLQAGLIVLLLLVVLAGGFSSERGLAANSPAGIRPAGAIVNPAADLYGWEPAASRAVELAREHHARTLVVMNWSLASRLAWYARPMAVIAAPDHVDQFALWFGHLEAGDSAVVVDWSGMPLPIPMGQDGFARCTPIDQLAIRHGNRQIAHFNYLFCEHWRRSGPAPSPPDAQASPRQGAT